MVPIHQIKCPEHKHLSLWQKWDAERRRAGEFNSSDSIYRLYLQTEENKLVPLSLPHLMDYYMLGKIM